MIALPILNRIGQQIVNNPTPLLKLGLSLDSIGLKDCSEDEGRNVIDFVMARVQSGEGKLDRQILPKKSRINAALLGAFPIHNRIDAYGLSSNLQDAVESKIGQTAGEKYILAIHSLSSCYCLTTDKFSYHQLMEINERTSVTDFLVVLPQCDGFFIFLEDDPACLISFDSSVEFGKNFVSAEAARKIFDRHMLDWRINSLPSQREWLEAISYYISKD